MCGFISGLSPFNHFQFALIHGPNIPGSYAILLFTTSDFTSITSHIHNWVLFLLWACLFILSRVISLLISSSILGTYQFGELIFQCRIFLPSHTVHGVLKAGMLKWFALPFSSGPCFVRTLHHDSSIWVALYSVPHSFIKLHKAGIIQSFCLVFCDCGFHSACPLIDEDKRSAQAS